MKLFLMVSLVFGSVAFKVNACPSSQIPVIVLTVPYEEQALYDLCAETGEGCSAYESYAGESNRQYINITIPYSQNWAQYAVYHTVERGDSWEKIADTYGRSVSELQYANPDLVRDHGWLLVGDVIKLPGGIELADYGKVLHTCG